MGICRRDRVVRLVDGCRPRCASPAATPRVCPPAEIGAAAARLHHDPDDRPGQRPPFGRIMLNGRPGAFLIDTGAGATIIHAPYLARFALAGRGAPEPRASRRQGAIRAGAINALAVGGARTRLNRIYAMDLSYLVDAVSALARVADRGTDRPGRASRPEGDDRFRPVGPLSGFGPTRPGPSRPAVGAAIPPGRPQPPRSSRSSIRLIIRVNKPGPTRSERGTTAPLVHLYRGPALAARPPPGALRSQGASYQRHRTTAVPGHDVHRAFIDWAEARIGDDRARNLFRPHGRPLGDRASLVGPSADRRTAARRSSQAASIMTGSRSTGARMHDLCRGRPEARARGGRRGWTRSPRSPESPI